MAEIGLQRSGIDTFVGERVAAGMPEHVGVDLEADLGFVTGAGRASARRGCHYKSNRSTEGSS